MTLAKGEGFIQNTLTLLSGNESSDAVRIPRNCSVVTFFQPSVLSVQGAVAGYASPEVGTWKIQTMVPTSSSDDAQDIIWADATYWSPEGTSVQTLVFPYSANTALSFPSWMLGGGQIRINAGIIQSSTTTFVVFFSGFNN